MYCGSIAIALSDPYGDGSSGEVSVIGRSWSRRWPAKASQAAVRSRSPISPIPQLRADGIENNGHSRPARRSLGANVMNETMHRKSENDPIILCARAVTKALWRHTAGSAQTRPRKALQAE